jgi:hypothetical protein
MTKLRCMAVVGAWLESDQDIMDFAKDHGVDFRDFLYWILEYGQPPDRLGWIPVGILDGDIKVQELEGYSSGYCRRPDMPSSLLVQGWVPVVIQERP